MLTLVLQAAGHVPHAVTNGEEALRAVDGNRFDLVITDLIMPDKDGVEVIMALHKKFPDLPILAISGGGRVEAQQYLNIAGKLGATRLLSKPFSREQLLESVSQMI